MGLEIDITGAIKRLNAVRPDNSMPFKDRRAMLMKAMKPIRQAVAREFMASVDSDPRRARQGVKTSVYKDGNGANVSILTSKKASGVSAQVTHTGGKSGIIRHRKVSAKTLEMRSYYGKNRSFVLRFVNLGTRVRTATTINANRGFIKARHFFKAGADAGKGKAMDIVEAWIKFRAEEAAKKQT